MAIVAERALRFRTDRVFYTGLAATIVVATFLGFARTFYLRGYLPLPPAAGKTISPLLIVHGVVATAWVAVFLAQTLLVVRGRVDLHRRLGMFGAAAAVAMLVIGVIVAIDALRRGVGPFGIDPRVWFIGFTLPGILAFGSLVAAGVSLRRKPEAHKRLMLLATFALLGPVFGRLIGFNFEVTSLSGFLLANIGPPDAFVVAAVLYDLWRRHRVHPALMFGGAALVSFPILLVAGNTPAGLALGDIFR